MIPHHRLAALRTALIGLATSSTLSVYAFAADSPFDPPKLPPNTLAFALIPQDFSDCTNTTVQDDPNRTRGGEILVTRNKDGTATVKVGLTAAPNTTYHFYLKCIRSLGDIVTDDEGSAVALFTFQVSEVGATFAFDSYPEGAPAGNKFQSVTATMPALP